MLDEVKNLVKKTPIFLKYSYKRFYGLPMNFKTPQKLSEKMQILKRYVYPYRKDVIQAADKYTLHDYLKSKNLEELSVPYLKVYESAENFDITELPKSFVLKKTNASSFNLIIKDKDKITEQDIKKTIRSWFSIDFGKIQNEFHYSKAKDRVICEPYFENLGNEFRFFMVNGEIGFIQVIVWDWSERLYKSKIDSDSVIQGHSKHYRLHFNENWELYWKDNNIPDDLKISKPTNWKELKLISKKIAKNFPVVRIDFNTVNNRLKIIELTFTPASGFLEILKQKPKLDVELGNKLRIEDYFE